MSIELNCRVNGREVAASVTATLRLVDWLRDGLCLTGTKIGCEEGVCGSCTVLIGGRAARSCLVFAAQCAGAAILTVEGLREGDVPTPAQAAFHRHQAFQCGFCTAGFLMVVEEMLEDHRRSPLDEEEIGERLSSVICRCTGYRPIQRAVVELMRAAT